MAHVPQGPRPSVVAIEFFHVGCGISVARLSVVFVIERHTRLVHVLGVTRATLAPAFAESLDSMLRGGMVGDGSSGIVLRA